MVRFIDFHGEVKSFYGTHYHTFEEIEVVGLEEKIYMLKVGKVIHYINKEVYEKLKEIQLYKKNEGELCAHWFVTRDINKKTRRSYRWARY